MPRITTSDGVKIFFKDHASGQPIVFSHGWPLSTGSPKAPSGAVAILPAFSRS